MSTGVSVSPHAAATHTPAGGSGAGDAARAAAPLDAAGTASVADDGVGAGAVAEGSQEPQPFAHALVSAARGASGEPTSSSATRTTRPTTGAGDAAGAGAGAASAAASRAAMGSANIRGQLSAGLAAMSAGSSAAFAAATAAQATGVAARDGDVGADEESPTGNALAGHTGHARRSAPGSADSGATVDPWSALALLQGVAAS